MRKISILLSFILLSMLSAGAMKTPTRIGVFGVGYDVYWKQFDGLEADILKKMSVFREMLPQDIEVYEFGLIDNPQKAYEAAVKMQEANLDLLFCDMLTYATSGTFGAIVRNVKCPIVLVVLQPDKALDYTRANTYAQLYNDDICSLPEFIAAAKRLGGKSPDIIIGTLYDNPEAKEEIARYCRIATAVHDLKYARFGHIGHSLNSMLDMNFDPTMITYGFGSHIHSFEPWQLVDCYKRNTDKEIRERKKEILDFFDTPDPVSDPITTKITDADLTNAAAISVALDRFVEENALDGLAYYYEGEKDSDQQVVMSNLAVGNSLLTARHIPMCGESDVKTLCALMIMDRLGIGGSFAEFHPIDFNGGFILVGHDGPHNISIAEGKPVLRSLKKYHGKPGSGAGVEFKIKEGPITILSINSTADGKFKFVVAEGESVAGPIPPTGNTNTRGFFGNDICAFLKEWASEGPTHHFALGIGHHAEEIAKVAEYLGQECVIVKTR